MKIVGRRILIFGDSLSHPGSDSGPEVSEYTGPINSSAPGAVLAGKLKLAGAAATRTDARVSRSATNFWSREDATGLLTSDLAWRPDAVIIMLGTNGAADAPSLARIRDVFATNGIEVWGVGPPAFASGSGEPMVSTMATVFGDHFIDSRPLTADMTRAGRASDGVHFTAEGAQLFADRLLGAVSKASSSSAGIAIGLSIVLGIAFLGAVISRSR